MSIDDTIQFNYPYGMKVSRVSPVRNFGKTYLLNWPYVNYHKSFKVIWPWTNEQEDLSN